MKKYIIALFFIFCHVTTFACQEMSYDPWIHFINYKEFYDNNKFMLWHKEGNVIYGAHRIKAGTISNNRIYDCYGSVVATKKGDVIYDEHNVVIFKINGNRIYDSKGRVVVTIKNNKVYNDKDVFYGELK